MVSFYHFRSATNNGCSKKCFHTNANACTEPFNKMSLFHIKFGHPNSQCLVRLIKLIHPHLFSSSTLNQASKHLSQAC